MPDTMRALVKAKPEVGLWMDDVPRPGAIGAADVRIRVLRTGICGTDVHIYNWDAWAQKTVPTPMVVGHEFVGRVTETGADVCDVAVGDIVSGEGHLVCGQCRNCMAGRRHLCRATMGVGVNRPGAFAEELVLPLANVWKHRPPAGADAAGARAIPRDVQAIFDPFGNAVHTALAFPVLGEDVLVTGAGPIGIMAAAVARHAGARHVVITDVNPDRLALARAMGVEHAVDARSVPLADVQRELGMTEGFDVGMEMSGAPVALRDMVENMAHGGRVAMLGIPTEDAAIDWNTLVFNMLTVRGIYGREMFETWYKMTAMLENGLDIRPVITHRFAAEDFQRGFDAMRSGKSGKVVLVWDDEGGERV